METYLVTGAYGHIGSFVLRELLRKESAIVTALVRESSNPWRVRDILSHPRLRILFADRSDTEAVRVAVDAAHAETVIDCAWEGVTGVNRNDTGQITRNIRAALTVFEAAQSAGMKNYVGVGSQAEYGSSHIAPRHEAMYPNPDTAYGVAKVCVQMATQKMADLTEIRYLWLRVFSVYGPQDDHRHMLPTLIRSLMRGERPALTPGEQTWDYLHVVDNARAIVAALDAPRAEGIFNIASGASATLRSVIEKTRDLIDPTLPLGFGDIAYRSDQVMQLDADISRLKKTTGWQPTISLTDGLRETVNYYKRFPTVEDEQDHKYESN